jgi:hypothetical protein
MTDMAELQARKKPINLAVVHVDPDAFVAHFTGWLEITSFITALRAGEAVRPADGATPKLDASRLRSDAVKGVGNDAVFAFCMTAALKADKAAVDKMEEALVESYGKEFPGVNALWYFRANIEAPVSLDDFVGQAAKKMLSQDIPPPPLRAKENWNAGLRFFEKARKSNFVHEIMYPLAKWHRDRWEDTAQKGVAFLHHIEDNVPALREALEDPRNDEAFVANLLLKSAPAVDMELADDMRGYLRSLARRI